MTTTEPEATEAKKTTVTVTVDGVTFEAQPGELLIKAAQEHGIYIPRFCWHERMKPVGMCRMCLVEIDGVRGFPPACTTPVADGMVVHTQNDTVKKIQDGVLEFLLDQPPARLPGVRPRRRVPAAGPDARVRARRVALRRGEAPLPEADPAVASWCCSTASAASSARAAPLRRRDRGRRAHRLRRPRRSHAGAELRGAAVRLVLLGQHRADLPGRRAHREPVPLPRPAVGPLDRRDVVHDVRGAVPGRGAVVVEPARAPARRRLRAGQPRLAVRQGSLRHRVGALRQPRARAARPRRTAS